MHSFNTNKRISKFLIVKLRDLGLKKRNFSDYSIIGNANNDSTGSMQAWTTELFNTSPILKEVPIPQIYKDDQLLLRLKVFFKF